MKRTQQEPYQSPDVAQEIMEKVLQTLRQSEVYIDDVGAFSDMDVASAAIETILERLQKMASQ
jgi:hypothetical protein